MITAVIEGRWEVREGDSAELLRSLPDNSIDAMVCDPPAGIGFMGRAWDKDKGGRDQWIVWLSGIMAESLRVVKPGGHALVWALPRTSHWTATAVEDAGWEIRDVFHHLFGSGFPKSLDISKEIDKSDASGIRRDRALAFTAWIRESGLSARAINERLGSFMGSHYLTDREQPEVATAESFDRLRPLLPAVPDWVEELVRERTVESAAYKAREIVASVRRMGVPPQPMGWGPPPVARDGKRAAGAQLAGVGEEWNVTVPSTPEGAQWAGWGTGIKPAVERWIWATKPIGALDYVAILDRSIGQLEEDLWKRYAGDAARGSGHTPAPSSEEKESTAPAHAPTRHEGGPVAPTTTGPGDATSLEAGTSPSTPGSAPTPLSIARSWRGTLAALSVQMSTYTTEMASNLTIDLKTLRSYLSRITPDAMHRAEESPGGSRSLVLAVDALLHALRVRCDAIQALSALGPATETADSSGASGDGSREGDNDPPMAPGSSRAAEHWILARKPIAEDTIAANVLAWGTGALNIDASRIPGTPKPTGFDPAKHAHEGYRMTSTGAETAITATTKSGRWPANVVLSCCGEDPHVEGCPVGALERQSEGSSKFFYQAKPSRAERDHGLGHLPHRAAVEMAARAEGSAGMQSPSAGAGRKGGGKNHHPTVKSTGLMDHLIGLVTPPGGIVLDPFCGSGSTGVAAVAGGWRFLGLELDPEYASIARARIAAAGAQLRLFDPSTEEADQDGR